MVTPFDSVEASWRIGVAPAGAALGQLSRAFDFFQARQLQIAALLGAHGIEVRWVVCSVGEDARRKLAQA